MAANEAIIRAAGQRYAPKKVDYSGYIQGVSAIASGLIQKKKNFDKKHEGIEDTYSDQLKYIDNPDVINQLKILRREAYDALDATKGLNVFSKKHRNGKALHKKRVQQMENLSIDYARGEKLYKNIVRANGEDNASQGEDVLMEAWWADVRDNGFEYSYMNEKLHVKGPQGEFVPYSDIPKTFLTVDSSSGIKNVFSKNLDQHRIGFRVKYDSSKVQEEYEAGGTLHEEMLLWDEKMDSTISQTMDLISDVNGGINDAFKSFSVDQKLRLPDGSGTTTFARYYMSNPDLYGATNTIKIKDDPRTSEDESYTGTIGGFEKAFIKQNENVTPDLINKQINIIFNDIIKNGSDPDIMQDMEDFLRYLHGKK